MSRKRKINLLGEYSAEEIQALTIKAPELIMYHVSADRVNRLMDMAGQIVSSEDEFWSDNLSDYGFPGNVIPKFELIVLVGFINFLTPGFIDPWAGVSETAHIEGALS